MKLKLINIILVYYKRNIKVFEAFIHSFFVAITYNTHTHTIYMLSVRIYMSGGIVSGEVL